MTDRCGDCGVAIVEVAAPDAGLCASCAAERRAASASVYDVDMPTVVPTDLHDLRHASPAARAITAPGWLWRVCDDGAPLGSDTGADTLSAFKAWRRRHKSHDPLAFEHDLLTEWEVADQDWEVLDIPTLERMLPQDHFNVLTRDDVAIATAFSELFVDGRVSRPVLERAILAIRRQSLSAVVEFRGWADPEDRTSRLQAMRSILERAGEISR